MENITEKITSRLRTSCCSNQKNTSMIALNMSPHFHKNLFVLFQAFTEGITNQLIGCFVGSLQEPGCVLVRINGRMTDLYVSRDREVKMLQVFHAHGCGPEIYCTFQNGICYKFIPGSVLEDHLLQQPGEREQHSFRLCRGSVMGVTGLVKTKTQQ
uniref:ethanolamine kinase n=1 Tax=Oryzias sinensis TaxID=183150 RepID=A0A8C8DI85_9TELE